MFHYQFSLQASLYRQFALERRRELRDVVPIFDMTKPIKWFTERVGDFSPELHFLQDDDEWENASAMGRHLRECVMRKDRTSHSFPMLFKMRQYDGNFHEGGAAVTYVLLQINWDDMSNIRYVSILDSVARNVLERCSRLSYKWPSGLKHYWMSSAMAKDIKERYYIEIGR